MPAESEAQVILQEAKDKFQSLLHTEWNRLLWEPELQLGGQTIKGVVIPSESLVETSDHTRAITRTLYVTPLGEIHSMVFDKLNPPPNGTMYGEVSHRYYALLAEGAVQRLDKLQSEQTEFLEKDPEGKEVMWKTEVDLFGNTRVTYIGYPKAPTPVFVRQGKLYCPRHREQELVKDRFLIDSGSMGLSCPTDPDHFWVFTK